MPGAKLEGPLGKMVKFSEPGVFSLSGIFHFNWNRRKTMCRKLNYEL